MEHVGGAPLDRDIKRHLGIGNATGLGMAPFLVSHPLLLDAWMQVRETALARVRAIPSLTPDRIADLYDVTARAAQHLAEWQVDDAIAQGRIEALRHDWLRFADMLTPEVLLGDRPLDRVMRQVDALSVDTQELAAAVLIEPFGDLVDGLCDCMATPFLPQIEAAMPCAALSALIARDWAWALALDFADRRQTARFWYVSAAKQEPRLGQRWEEPGADLESPLDIARQVQALARDLAGGETVAAFLRAHPQHRAAVRRVQTLARHPYAEIRDNLIGQDCLPIDMLRCKLAFFGASKFDPRSDRWTRITLAQGAPLHNELRRADHGFLPVAPA